MKSHQRFPPYRRGLCNSLSFNLVMKCEVGGLGLRHACVRFNVNQLYRRRKCDFWQAKMWFAVCLSLSLPHTPAGARLIELFESRRCCLQFDIFLFFFWSEWNSCNVRKFTYSESRDWFIYYGWINTWMLFFRLLLQKFHVSHTECDMSL